MCLLRLNVGYWHGEVLGTPASPRLRGNRRSRSSEHRMGFPSLLLLIM